MSKNISNRFDDKIATQGVDVLPPLASQSLFWRPKFLEDASNAQLIPLIFWLTEATKPRYAVTLGMSDPSPHFALCQAVDKIGLDSLCLGMSTQSENGNGLDGYRAYNAQNYSDFSLIRDTDQAGTDFLSDEKKIDLLLLNTPVSEELSLEIEEKWLNNMSSRGVVVFLKGSSDPKGQEYMRKLYSDHKTFELFEKGVGTVCLFGEHHDDRLYKLTSLEPGEAGYLSVKNVFCRLGDLHSKTVAVTSLEKNLMAAQEAHTKAAQELNTLRGKLDEVSSQAEKTLGQYRERSGMVAVAQAEAFDIKEKNAALHEQIKELNVKTTQAEARIADYEALQGKVASLESELADRDEEINQRITEVAILGMEIDSISSKNSSQKSESTEMEARNRKLKKQIEALSHRVKSLETSTSWRITSPLRGISKMFRS
ncbi:MAG: hypothetical protein ACSHWZ_18095 [Sulfitobacter sp.]